MLTKTQKKEHVAKSTTSLKNSKSVVFADFSGVPTKDINQLKSELRKAGASLKVVKKRLLNIALKEAGIAFDPLQFKAPVAAVFAPAELTSVAGPIYKFSRDLAKRKIEFKVVGAFDRDSNAVLSTQEFTIIAKLPSREVLLAQVVGAMSGPLRAFMYIVSELSKRQPASAEAPAGKPAEAAPAAAAPAEAPKTETANTQVESK
jgi:large subunit ribosomal protein L10